MAASEVLFDIDPQVNAAMDVDPRLLLVGPAPRLLDEWQLEPEIWNHVRREVDERNKHGLKGQFILAGSAVPADDVTRHSGAGRIARLRMRPMSLAESGYSSGAISLAALLAGNPSQSDDSGLTVPEIAERIAVGGWPAIQRDAVPQALTVVRGYIDEICRVDVQRVRGVRHDPDRVRRLLRSLARNVTTYVGAQTLALDTGGDDAAIDEKTTRGYLDDLGRIFVTEDQGAWSTHLRSRSTLRKSAKRLFVDPSLAVAALAVTPERLLDDLNLLGLLFENLVIRDLRIHAQAAEGQVLQYRDNTGLEVDAIVELPNGSWGAFEVKLGAGQVEAGANSLLRFRERVDATRAGQPAVLGVIVATGYGYLRGDGIAVIPIGALAA